MTMPHEDAVAARLDRLERQNRRLRIAFAAVGPFVCLAPSSAFLSPGLVPAAGANHATTKVIEVQGLVLRDVNGIVRAELGFHKSSVGPAPRLVFFDDQGRARVGLGAAGSGSGVFISDSKGKSRITLTVDSANGPSLLLGDQSGKVCSALKLDNLNGPTLTFVNSNGKPLAELRGPRLLASEEEKKGGMLILYDEHGQSPRIIEAGR